MIPIELQIRQILEAFIFSQSEPVSEKILIELLKKHGIGPQNDNELQNFVRSMLINLQQNYETRGFHLCEIAGGWQFRTDPELATYLIHTIVRPRRLSQATMETLAIIAYHQPCTRVDIEQIRGVTVGQPIIDALLEAGLITPSGYKKVPGRPILWKTTEGFLEYLGLKNLKDLPNRDELFGGIPYESVEP